MATDWLQSTQANATFVIGDDDEEEEIYFGSFRGDVVGLRYYAGKVNNHEMVSLHREPNNPYDRNAIRVDNVLGQQVGHIKREQASVLASLVDGRKAKIEGVVPFGTKNKFTMPCDISLCGSPANQQYCKDLLRRRGYSLGMNSDNKRHADGSSASQSTSKGAPARPSYVAKTNSTKERVQMTGQQLEREIDTLFESTFDKGKQKIKEPSQSIKIPLYNHQKQALAWMVSRENNENLPPFWKRQGTNYNLSIVNHTTKEKPEIVKGGILADDMGLGKTLSIISLIVTNYRNEQPLVNIDKTSSVQQDIMKKKPAVSRKRKSKESCVIIEEEDGDVENEEPPLPSFDHKEDVDYKPPPATVATSQQESSQGATIASKRSKRTASKKPRYNFDDDDDWVGGEELDSPVKPKQKRGRKSKSKAVEETQESVPQTTQPFPNSESIVLKEKDVMKNETVSTSQKGSTTETVTAYKITKNIHPGPRATLIVCPLSVIHNWQHQLETHLEYGALDVYVYYGSDRCQNPDELAKKDVILTTYQTLSTDFAKMSKTDYKKMSALHQVNWLRVVLDEGHCIRNITSNQSKACIALNSERRWFVTGTPVQNSFKDLYAVLCFLRVSPFHKRPDWWKRIIERPLNAAERGGDVQGVLEILQAILLNISIRRTKQHKVNNKSVVDLPPKNIYVQYIEMSEEERKLYETFKNEGKAILERYITENKLSASYAHMLVILMRLRQLCCHPKLCAQILDCFNQPAGGASQTPEKLMMKLQQILTVLLSSGDEECPICLDAFNNPVITHCAHLYCRPCIEGVIRADKPKCPLCRNDISKEKLVEPAAEKDDTINGEGGGAKQATWSSSSKVDGLITMLKQESEENPRRKHLVVSQFAQFLNLLEKPIQESGYKFVRLDGSMTMKQRTDAITRFSDKSDDSPTIMLLSLKAGGVGLNLTAATRVFLMDPAWNPASEDQCFDRCHRLGQTEEVKVYKFVVKNTVEEKMLELQDKKRDMMKRTFGPKQSSKDRQKMRIEDVQTLFS